ncbi:hypothetical protein ACVWXM_009934 [Bradyrhizobium sp. GM7.3]
MKYVMMAADVPWQRLWVWRRTAQRGTKDRLGDHRCDILRIFLKNRILDRSRTF